MLYKTMPCEVKIVGEQEAGIVEMMVSTYGVDSWGDRVMPGAFAETLAEWKAKGDPIPFIFAHQSNDPGMYVGKCLEAEERPAQDNAPGGLWIKAQMFMNKASGLDVFHLLKERLVTQASFAYDVVDSAPVKEGDRDINELRKLKLYETGPCLIGMNQETELLSTKDFRVVAGIMRSVKAGRTISAKNEELLRTAHEAIGAVLSALDSDEGGKSGTTGNEPPESGAAGSSGVVKAEAGDGKTEDQTPPDPLALDLLELDLMTTENGI